MIVMEGYEDSGFTLGTNTVYVKGKEMRQIIIRNEKTYEMCLCPNMVSAVEFENIPIEKTLEKICYDFQLPHNTKCMLYKLIQEEECCKGEKQVHDL